MHLVNVGQLDAGQVSALMTLIRRAEAVDHVAPLSEQALLTARDSAGDDSGASAGSDTATGTNTDAASSLAHFLAYDGTHLAGYAHLDRGPVEDATADAAVDADRAGTGAPASAQTGVTAAEETGDATTAQTQVAVASETEEASTAQTGVAAAEGIGVAATPQTGAAATVELVVDPADRRQGVATALVHAIRDALGPEASKLQIWSHGHLDGARALAARGGYTIVRELWSMHRPLLPDAGSLPEVTIPEGFTARQFVVGQDEDAWLGVNARAFADHAEQGRLTRHDLDLRIAEPWFDTEGFILVEDTRGAAPVLAASHWTKIVPSPRPRVRQTRGEVYVVGVDPAYQGLGLGRAVTLLGLEHLRGRGVTEAVLFVDADNTAAVATYSRLGFTRFAVDVMYSPAVHPLVTR
ncbi:MAG: mycothiol synthase [Dermatophilaceae bacterium]